MQPLVLRVYYTTTVKQARQIMSKGFTGQDAIGDTRGAVVSLKPLEANDGADGDVTLTLRIPLDVFNEYEIIESDSEHPSESVRSGMALVPADKLKGDPVVVYDHTFAGSSRRELFQTAQQWEQAGRPEHAAEMRAAIEFFDEIGWQTPLKLQEQKAREGR